MRGQKRLFPVLIYLEVVQVCPSERRGAKCVAPKKVVQDILLRWVIWCGQSKLLGGGEGGGGGGGGGEEGVGGGGEAIASKHFVCLPAKSA